MNGRTPTAAKRHARSAETERLEVRNRELTRALHATEEARASLADQYDFAPIGFVTLDATGCIRAVNLTAARMLGRSRAQLLERPFLTHLVKNSCTEFLRFLCECAKTQGEVVKDMTLHPLGRSRMPVELRAVPVLDPRRGDTVFRTTIIDLTERVRAGNALRESEERYRALVEFSPDGIYVLSDGGIVFSNTAGLRLCGVKDLKELRGRDIAQCVRAEFRSELNAALRQAADGREMPPVEVKFARDHASVDVELAARPFRHDGEPAVLVVARDISRRKAAERHVLEISERERNSFGRDLHDSLCQNLTGVSCLAEALRNDLRQIHPASAAEAHEIAKFVRDCVAEARSLARGLCPVTMEKSGLAVALHELTATLISRNHIACTLDCDDSLTIKDVTVATHLYRIAQEAVANAISHGRAKSLRIQLTSADEKMTLCVQDDGKGFPARSKQTGMGLHTMRYRASIIGGSFEVRGVRPRGTLVTCTIPIIAEP